MNLNALIEQVGREKNIDRAVLVDSMLAAMKKAAKTVFGEQREIEATYNEETGAVELFLLMTVAEDIDGEVENRYREITVEQARRYVDPAADVGDELLFPIFYREEDAARSKDQEKRFGRLLNLRQDGKKEFGRIAAQSAKQVLLQRMREAERDRVYDEFKDRRNQLITGIVRRFEKGNVVVDLGKTDAVLPPEEQIRRESYRAGDRIQAFIKDVDRNRRNELVVLSRADRGLVIKLFEQEVPEIHEGIVRIVEVAREPGVRSKVAVYSRDPDVDPVGACVGMRGSRVQSVVQELRGEKIDIVTYHTDPARFACNAILPAQVTKVLVDDARNAMELVVPDEHLSLAIGRGGQNVRLAAQLTGWNLEIYSESRLRQLMADAKRQLLEFPHVTEPMIDTLFSVGYNKLQDISLAEVAELQNLPGFNEERALAVIRAAGEIEARPKSQPGLVTEEDLEKERLTEIRGVGDKMADDLHGAGYTDRRHLAWETDADRMSALTGLELKRCKQVLAAAAKWYEQQSRTPEEQEEEAEARAEFEERQRLAWEVRQARGAAPSAADGDAPTPEA
jgi:N utilization substance protein A